VASNTQKQDVYPLDADSLRALNLLASGFNPQQLLWSSAYLAGMAAFQEQGQISAPILSTPSLSEPLEQWTILYAGETGNSKGIAEQLQENATQAGLSVQSHNLRDYRPKALSKLENVLFIIATHGIGEAPEGSEPFFEYWLSDKAARLEDLHFSVLALGDSSYVDFCEMGKLLDQKLIDLGAKQLFERVDCDLDFDTPAETWIENVVKLARDNAHPDARSPVTPIRPVSKSFEYSRKHPFSAQILTDQRITSRDSAKNTRHIELDLAGSGLSYQPGDSLGVFPVNPPELINALLKVQGFSGDEAVVLNGETIDLRTALSLKKEITGLSKPFLDSVARMNESLQPLLEDRNSLSKLFKLHQVIDITDEYVPGWDAQNFVNSLRSLTPRLYSIASCPDFNEGEAHLTVDVVRYEKFGRDHWGSASNYLASGVDQVSVYIESNDNFRLPTNPDTPVIMIGAGTGIAPYRAFVEHRREHGHTGDNWLIFGNRNFSDDFLYQTEWLRYLKDGSLKFLDLAFSRDQEEKVYVQHCILQQEHQIYAWLDRGAHIYVCGDADGMAGEVNLALLDVLQNKGGLSLERADEYLVALKNESRYQRDVY